MDVRTDCETVVVHQEGTCALSPVLLERRFKPSEAAPANWEHCPWDAGQSRSLSKGTTMWSPLKTQRPVVATEIKGRESRGDRQHAWTGRTRLLLAGTMPHVQASEITRISLSDFLGQGEDIFHLLIFRLLLIFITLSNLIVERG